MAVAVAPPAVRESAPKPALEPTREPKPLSDEPSMDITTPRFVAEPVRVSPGTPPMPDLSGIEPEPVMTRSDDGRVSFSLSVGMLAGIVGGVVVVLVLFGTSLYSLGSRASKEELKPILSDQATRAIEESDASPSRDLSIREPIERPTREPIPDTSIALTPEPVAVPPVVETPPADDSPVASESTDTAAAQDDAAPSGPTNVDRREPGLNYMYTSMTFDRDEAVGAQQFLFDNGIDSIVEEMTRASDGQKAYRLWTLVGIPGQGFNTSREKFDHERAIFDLGNEWLTEQGGTLDFSRKNQIGWIKYGG